MSTYRSIFSLASSVNNVLSRAIVGTGMVLFGFSANSLAASSNDIALSYEAGGACYCTSAALAFFMALLASFQTVCMAFYA